MKLKRWDTGKVIFETECSSWEELLKGALKAKVIFFKADFRDADFRGADFSDANFRYSDFRGADFSGADFSGADFRYSDFRYSDFSNADFRDADFRGSKHQYKIGNMVEWHSMLLETYVIGFNSRILTIGCQQNTIKKWKEFTDTEISKMDKGALEWWRKWKDFIFQAIELCEVKK
jgi:hypothetical protein